MNIPSKKPMGGVGLALMIHALAVERTDYNGMTGVNKCYSAPSARDAYRCGGYRGTTTGEYMAILDRLEAGEKP